MKNDTYKVLESEEMEDGEMMIHVIDNRRRNWETTKYAGINVIVNKNDKVTDLVVDGNDKLALKQSVDDREQIVKVALEYYVKETATLD